MKSSTSYARDARPMLRPIELGGRRAARLRRLSAPHSNPTFTCGTRSDVADDGVDRPGRHASVPEGALSIEEGAAGLGKALEERAAVFATQFGRQLNHERPQRVERSTSRRELASGCRAARARGARNVTTRPDWRKHRGAAE